MARAPRVLVTRSPHQASALAEALRQRGAEPVLVPTIEIAPPESWAELDDAIAGLLAGDPAGQCDWLVFTSTNAVEAFGARLKLAGASGLKWRPKIAAIGAATARALSELGLAPDLMPAQAVAESLAEALVPFARTAEGRPGRFLLVRAEQGREVLPEALRAAGAEVRLATAYRNVVPEGSVEALRELFRDRAAVPDAVTFTSSSGVRNLFDLCAAAAVKLPESVLRVSIGPVTSATLREFGLPPHVEAEVATVESLANVLMLAWGMRDIG